MIRLSDQSKITTPRATRSDSAARLQEIGEQTLRSLEAGRLAVIHANTHLLSQKIGEPLLAKLIESDMRVLHNSFVPAIDAAFCEGLQSNGYDITAAIIRDGLVPRVLAAIDDREAEIRQSLELRLFLVGGNSDRCVPFMLDHLSQEMSKLKDYIKNHYDIKIAQLETQESQAAQVDGAVPRPRRKKARSRAPNKAQERPISATQRRASVVAKIIKELRVIKPDLHNQGHWNRLKGEHPKYLIFKIAQKDASVKEWIENVQDRNDIVKLAQEIAAKYFGKTISTLQTDWSHRKMPRKTG